MVTCQVPESLLIQFTDLLAEKMGLHYPRDRWHELEKKLQPCVSAFGFEEMTPCLEWLLSAPLHSKQIAELAYHLTIGETYFFRDTKMFAALEKHILPEIIHRHRLDRKIRIWSAGCCTGEEPYSVAILLDRLLQNSQSWDIWIVGTDINQEFLDKAVRGIYSQWSFRATPKEVRDRYFHVIGKGAVELNPDIRRRVQFSFANLVDDADKVTGGFEREFDLVLCNNVLIYFSQQQIQNTVRKLVKALLVHGWLTVTPIEAPYVVEDQLTTHHFMGSILFQKESTPRYGAKPEQIKRPAVTESPPATAPSRDPMLLKVVLPEFLNLKDPVLEYHFLNTPSISPPLAPKEKPTEPVQSTAVAQDVFSDCMQLCRAKRPEKAVEVLLELLAPHRDESAFLHSHLRELMLLIRVYANTGELKKALEWCLLALKANRLEPVLHYLHAEVQSASGDTMGAIQSLQHAIFLEPNLVAAHYLLGMLEQQRGKEQAANREFTTALRLVEQMDPEAILLGTEELTVKTVRDHLLATSRRS